MKGKIVLLTAFMVASSFSAESAEQGGKPNIIIIYMDDLGYGDLTITGAINYRTPNLDRLAHEGMLFTQYYSPARVCTASRAGLLTGCYPERLGNIRLLFPNSTKGLNPDEEIIPEILRTKGYYSLMIGKWHLGDAHEFMPIQQGFDEYFGMLYSNDMWPYGRPRRGDKNPEVVRDYPSLWLYDGNKKYQEIKTQDDQDLLTTMFTERAVSFIKNNESRNTPFFLYLAHPMPHIPLGVSSRFLGKSKQGEYGDVMLEIDWSIGEIVDALEETGLTENTLIIFTSDNGPWLSFGDHGGLSGAFREGKFTAFEGGYRVPCIIKWPAIIPKGVICNQLVSGIDILPTLANITGAELPKNRIDGVSILPLLKGDMDAEPREFFIYNQFRAIRNNRFKLVFPHEYNSNIGVLPNDGGRGSGHVKSETDFALYDLRRDPGERSNVIERYQDIADSLMRAMEEYKSELNKNGGIRPIGSIDK